MYKREIKALRHEQEQLRVKMPKIDTYSELTHALGMLVQTAKELSYVLDYPASREHKSTWRTISNDVISLHKEAEEAGALCFNRYTEISKILEAEE